MASTGSSANSAGTASIEKRFAEDLAKVSQFEAEQKLQSAFDLLEAVIEKGKSSPHNGEWAKLLARSAAFEFKLHRYEAALTQLRTRPWPSASEPLARATVALTYVQAILIYHHRYSFEIRQREKRDRVVGSALDYKTLTAEQLFELAFEVCDELWGEREKLAQYQRNALDGTLIANTFPEGVRPTLRDTLTYIFADLLEQRSSWTPVQLNSVYELDLKNLLSGHASPDQSSKAKAGLFFTTAQHPLQKLSLILSDLGAWHKKRGHLSATLEAQRVLHEKLRGSFTSADERVIIRKSLEKIVSATKQDSWVTMVMASVAQMLREEKNADREVHARQVAQAGIEAFPKSVGAARCREIIDAIEFPQFSLEGMKVDGVGQQTLGGVSNNLSTLYFKSYPVNPERRLKSRTSYYWAIEEKEIEALLSTKPVHEWSVQLGASKDYLPHRYSVTPPTHASGSYLIVASAKPGFERSDNDRRAVRVNFSDLVVSYRLDSQSKDLSTRVVSGGDGEGVSGVKLDLYRGSYDHDSRKVSSEQTSKGGEAVLSISGAKSGDFHLLSAKKGSDLVLSENPFYFYDAQTSGPNLRTFLYLDRSIYRPNQKISWKALAFRPRPDPKNKSSEGSGAKHADKSEPTNFEVAAGTTVTVTLRDANFQVVEAKTVTTDAFGAGHGEFVIPAGRLLGSWSVTSDASKSSKSSSNDDSSAYGQYSSAYSTSVRVEEYKRPTFEATIKDPKSPLRLNQLAKIVGDVRYYFGMPVSEGQVQWKVSRSAILPWWCFWRGWGGFSDSSGSQVVGSGVSRLKKDGSFEISFTPKADEKLAAGSGASSIQFRYDLTADVTDEGGETRTATRGFSVGFVAVMGTFENFPEFIESDAHNRNRPKIAVRLADLNGVARQSKANWRLVRLEQPSNALLPSELPPPLQIQQVVRDTRALEDLRSPRWNTEYSETAALGAMSDGEKIATGDLVHDAAGLANFELPELPAGAYRVYYETHDQYHTRFETFKEFIVAGAGVTAPAKVAGFLALSQPTAKVGEAFRVLAFSGFEGQSAWLEIHRSGRLVKAIEIKSGKTPVFHDFTVQPEDRGGLVFTLTAVRNYQVVQLYKSLVVPWADKRLTLDFSTFRDKITPAAREKWTVRVRGADQKSVEKASVQVLAYMYDRSLDSFVGHSVFDPISYFPWRNRAGPLSVELGAAPREYLSSEGFSRSAAHGSFLGDRFAHLSQYSTADAYGFSSGAQDEGRASFPGDSGALPPASPAAVLAEPNSDASSSKTKSASVSQLSQPAVVDQMLAGAGAKGAKDSNAPEAIRSNFNETAFWFPTLLTNDRGEVEIEFTVPDSVTSWNVWLVGLNRRFESGLFNAQTQSVKDLMVRPYLPRFLREGDEAKLKVAVNNATASALSGTVDFDLIDLETQKSALELFGLKASDVQGLTFEVKGRESTTIEVPIHAPARVGSYGVKVTARSKTTSDGELRVLPVLPGRFHLAQSRFAILKGKSSRELTFKDLASTSDPSRVNEAFNVTLDSQLFYSVLSAVPYLCEYPYENTETILNRFLGASILGSVFKNYPSVKKMAEKFSQRQTPLESFDQSDLNRKMALEESPWVLESKGGAGSSEPDERLRAVLDPKVSKALERQSIEKLEKLQLSSGAFPWFAGGPDSLFTTVYLLHGFSKATEFGVTVPEPMVAKAWQYLHREWFLREFVKTSIADGCCVENVTLLNYVLSQFKTSKFGQEVFTEAERAQMLDFSFKHWKSHSGLLKGYLALTLNRAGRKKDATLVWESVMDSAKTSEDEGTHWTAEDRSWLWYNDTIESQAFALRAGLELGTDAKRLDGMVLWLLLNKKLNHWKSTRATAEVLYSLTSYLAKTGELGVKEDAAVTFGNSGDAPVQVQKHVFEFDPTEYTGKKNQIAIAPEKVGASVLPIKIEKTTPGYLFASATWQFSTERLPAEASGDFIKLTRRYFKRVSTDGPARLIAIDGPSVEANDQVKLGDELEVHLSVTSQHELEYVHLRDPRPAGFEPADLTSKHHWNSGLQWYQEVRDSATNFFFEHLPKGEFTLKYRLRAATEGVFKASPATVQPLYAPEFSAYSSGRKLGIKGM